MGHVFTALGNKGANDIPYRVTGDNKTREHTREGDNCARAVDSSGSQCMSCICSTARSGLV